MEFPPVVAVHLDRFSIFRNGPLTPHHDSIVLVKQTKESHPTKLLNLTGDAFHRESLLERNQLEIQWDFGPKNDTLVRCAHDIFDSVAPNTIELLRFVVSQVIGRFGMIQGGNLTDGWRSSTAIESRVLMMRTRFRIVELGSSNALSSLALSR